MRPAVLTAALLLGVLLCGGGSTYARTMEDVCESYPSRSCGDRWEQLDDNRCMKFFWSSKSFYGAKNACFRLKGNMVSLHDENQMMRVACLVWRSKTTKYKVWIGAFRWYGETKYHNSDGTPLDYTNWYPGLTPNQGSKRCVESNYRVWGRWHNIYCTEKRQFVCTKEM